MSFETDTSIGQKISHNGNEYTVVSRPLDFSSWIVVKDDSGNIIRLNKTEALFNYYKDYKAKQEEKIAEYQEKGRKFETIQADFRSKAKDFFAQMGLCIKGSDDYNKLKNQYWSAKIDATAAGNKAFSSFLQAFTIASDTSWI